MDCLLRGLEQSGFGATVCDLQAGNPTLADDLTLIAMTHLSLQEMLVINLVSLWVLFTKLLSDLHSMCDKVIVTI